MANLEVSNWLTASVFYELFLGMDVGASISFAATSKTEP
jgi:hypothetical protein